jgi:hypothetical protein
MSATSSALIETPPRPESELPALFAKVQTYGMIAAGLGLVLLLVTGFLTSWTEVWRGYLIAYFFWFGLSMGSLGIVFLYHLAGGRWGFIVRRPMEAGAVALVAMLVMFLPIVGLVLTSNPAVYVWLDPAKIASDPIIAAKGWYLNPGAWSSRALLALIVFIGFAFALRQSSLQQDSAPDGDFSLASRMRQLSGLGVLFYVVLMTMIAVDWAMSIEPHWFSAIYGVLFIVGQGLSIFAFIIVMVSVLVRFQPFAAIINKDRLDEYGKLMLAFVVLWAYVNYGQYIIIWSGNIHEFTPWYLNRLGEGWIVLSVFLMLFHFAVPFALLLSRLLKRNLRLLTLVAGWILFARLLEIFWLIAPDFVNSFGSPLIALIMTYIAAHILLGGVWFMAFGWVLQRQPVLPVNDLRNDPRAMKGQVAHA